MAFTYQADGTGTDAELLALNREMQARIMKNGQEYRTEDGKWMRLPDLAILQAEEKQLLARIEAASTGPATNLATFQRRP